jgi:hypothetical protein
VPQNVEASNWAFEQTDWKIKKSTSDILGRHGESINGIKGALKQPHMNDCFNKAVIRPYQKNY